MISYILCKNDQVVSSLSTKLTIFTVVFTLSLKQMDKLERPKGISLIPKGAALGYKGILIAAGMKKNNDSTFLPSSSGSNMEAKLKFYSIDVGETWII